MNRKVPRRPPRSSSLAPAPPQGPVRPLPERRRRPRPRAGRQTVWLFGTHAVLAALANPRRRCRRLLVTREAWKTLEPRLGPLAAARPELPKPEIAGRDSIAARLVPGAVHQGLALEAEPLPEPNMAEVLRAAAGAERAHLVVLDRVTDPHNAGAILRSAAAFGALAVIVTERYAPGETGTLAKSASGALEIVPLVRVKNLVRALIQFKEAGFWCVGLDAHAEHPLAGADLPDRVVLVLGAEDRGLRRLTRETCDLLLRLPASEAVESLNVSVAAGVALYELARPKGSPR